MPKVLIAGAGLVGALNAAYFAKRGWHVEVYELRPDIRLMEHGYFFYPNTIILIFKFLVDLLTWHFRSAENQPLKQWDFDPISSNVVSRCMLVSFMTPMENHNIDSHMDNQDST
jgi:2-polyprenyl-6-methoxyphenol hydroxylase-like FAD-dependent oxidoreductase